MRLSILVFWLFASLAYTQETAFQIYDKDGNKISYRILKQSCVKADVVLFGENHNDPISHWLELEMSKSLFEAHGSNLILGAEMLESDDQIVIDEYLLGFSREQDVEKEAKIWPNHTTDYRPLLNFAKDNKLHFVATNIPRRFANMVYRFGIDTLNYLPSASKQYIAPLPIAYDTTLRCYQEIVVSSGGHGGENLPKSQAIKDATMAYFIHQNMKENTKFLHFHGSYHSKYHESIMWYLLQLNSALSIRTIEVVESKNIEVFDKELIGNADFFILVDEDMCKTH